MAPKRHSFSQKAHMKSAKILKQNDEDCKTEKEMMHDVVNEKMKMCDFALRKVFNMTMGKQLDPPRFAVSDDDLPFASVKWRLLQKDLRGTALDTMLPNDTRMARFLGAKHLKSRVNDDCHLICLAIHEDPSGHLPDGPQSQERQRFSKTHVLGFMLQYNAYYGNRLTDIEVNDEGQVMWGATFGWFKVLAVPGQPGEYIVMSTGRPTGSRRKSIQPFWS
jgi:hypothetical protein